MIKVFADGADIQSIVSLYKNSMIAGFTTNPALLRKAGVTNYEHFAKQVLSTIREKPISFEVIADDLQEMYSQAIKISSWGENVYVKIPIMNTEGKSTVNLINKLAMLEIKLNITAILTVDQAKQAMDAIGRNGISFISIFAGRIADTWVDPVPMMREIVGYRNDRNFLGQEILWASVRESINLKQAEDCGCDIVTVPNDILKKLTLVGKDLTELSKETVKMFFDDATSSGYKL